MSKPTQKPRPPSAPMTFPESLAIAVAAGNAASTYATMCAHAAGDGDRLPAGNFWFAGGEVVERRARDAAIDAMAGLVLEHGAQPAEAIYLHLTARVKLPRRGPFAELPLPDRMAFAAFASSLPPLLIEARRQTEARRLAEVAPPPPLPDREGTIGERVWRKAPRMSDRTELGPRPTKEAAE